MANQCGCFWQKKNQKKTVGTPLLHNRSPNRRYLSSYEGVLAQAEMEMKSSENKNFRQPMRRLSMHLRAPFGRGVEEGFCFFDFPMCFHCVPTKFQRGSHWVPKQFPKSFPISTSNFFPYALAIIQLSCICRVKVGSKGCFHWGLAMSQKIW